eukprot:TRINITY_DN56527_c0_g1_i1.p1 TRINITY_DN56527_c0_g1~~TRINITY_DN56527_c0_g1_i1.p1  ORF type:complete len:387 (+),score=43.82 TRINITY_DN56527_c0_g1_i1:20-1180(+)
MARFATWDGSLRRSTLLGLCASETPLPLPLVTLGLFEYWGFGQRDVDSGERRLHLARTCAAPGSPTEAVAGAIHRWVVAQEAPAWRTLLQYADARANRGCPHGVGVEAGAEAEELSLACAVAQFVAGFYMTSKQTQLPSGGGEEDFGPERGFALLHLAMGVFLPAAAAVGWCYDVGCGVEQDDRQAAAAYSLGTTFGDPRALNNLGVMYDTGTGGAGCIHHMKAVELYTDAAEQGDAGALANLAESYASGTGVERDVDHARELYALAVAQGDHTAMCAYADLMLRLSRSEKSCDKAAQQAEAIALLQKAADAGSFEAKLKLGQLYHRMSRQEEYGGHRNIAEALLWEACSHNDTQEEAQMALYQLYVDFEGVTTKKAMEVARLTAN